MLKNIREMVRDKDGKAASDKAAPPKNTASISDPSEKVRAKAVAEHGDLDALLQLALSLIHI